jgi:hypothetical protein
VKKLSDGNKGHDVRDRMSWAGWEGVGASDGALTYLDQVDDDVVLNESV